MSLTSLLARRNNGLSGLILIRGGALAISLTPFLAGSAVRAQQNSPAPAIVPTNATQGATTPLPVLAPVPVPVAVPGAVPGTGAGLGTGVAPTIDELRFENIGVAELLNLIAGQFSVEIAIANDVDGVIRAINLSNKTPEQAIQTVVKIAGLNYVRENDGTYLVSKARLEAAPDMAPTAITPTSSAGAAWGSPLSAPVMAAPALSDGFGASRGRPAEGFGAAPSSLWQDLPDLKGFNNERRSSQPEAIRIRNVKASTMAYWIDPANHPVPMELQASAENANNYGERPLGRLAVDPDGGFISRTTGVLPGSFAPGSFSPYTNPYIASNSAVRPEVLADAQFGRNNNNNNRGGRTGGATGGAGGGVFQLPGEIDRIIAVDAQNVILVQGGRPEDIQELRNIINILDRPLRQVEIEAQFVTVSTSATNAFGIDFSSSNGDFSANTVGFAPGASSGAFQLGFVRGNFQATLTALVAQNRAKVLTAPRVTAINNLTASIASQTSSPILLTTTTSSDFNNNTAQSQTLIYINTSIGLTVTPTINNDDTITVLMQPQLQTQVPSGIQGLPAAPVVTSQQVFTVANVRDGDTIALGGLRTKNIARGSSKVPLLGDIPLIGRLFKTRNNSESESELIIFVTARIVRRAGFDDPIVAN